MLFRVPRDSTDRQVAHDLKNVRVLRVGDLEKRAKSWFHFVVQTKHFTFIVALAFSWKRSQKPKSQDGKHEDVEAIIEPGRADSLAITSLPQGLLFIDSNAPKIKLMALGKITATRMLSF